MKAYDGSHRETQTVLPEPLASAGFWNGGNFALPSTMLSAASAAVFIVVFGFLQLGAEQDLFLLPSHETSIVAAVGAVLAWAIAIRCRRRPGRVGPRIWALFLACLNSTIALLGYVFHDRSWPLALALAGLAAAITLAPRFFRLRPDSAMVQHIAPLSLMMILLIILPSACAVRHVIASETKRRVARRIEQLRLWNADLQEITGFDWRRLEDNPDAAARAVEKLERFHFKEDLEDAEIWRSAALIGNDEELSQAMQALTDQVVAGLAPERVPRVSDLKEAAVHWDADAKRWEAYAPFLKLSGITGTYYRELGRLFTELRDVPASDAKLMEYRQHYAGQRQLLQRNLRNTANLWSDNWAAFRVPDHAELIGRESEPLIDLLQTPFASGADETFHAGDLARLASTPLSTVMRCAQGSPGCTGAKTMSSPEVPSGAPGCHCQNFREHSTEYFRLDCYSYMPRKQDAGADLRVEMRLVYRSEPGRPLRGAALPSEVFFHFMIPDGTNGDEFRSEVMAALATTTRQGMKDGTVRSFDRGGSVAGGFDIDDGSNSVRVLRPAIVPLTGLDEEPKALQVRIVPKRAGDRDGRRFE